jgi:hypothetical protein
MAQSVTRQIKQYHGSVGNKTEKAVLIAIREAKQYHGSVVNKTDKAAPWFIPTAGRITSSSSFLLHHRPHRRLLNARQASDFDSEGAQLETQRYHFTAAGKYREFLLYVLPTIHSRHTNNTVNKFRNKIYYRYFLT